MSEPHGPLPEPLQTLGDELLAAADRHRYNAPAQQHESRSIAKRALTLAAVVVTFATIALGALVVGSDDPVAADVKVERDGDNVRVSIGSNANVDSIRSALERADVAVTVVGQTTGPSRQSRFLGVVAPRGARLVGGDTNSAPVVEFIEGADVTLIVGTPPDRANGRYEVPTTATDPGEPLAGETTAGATVEHVRALAEDAPRQLTISYRGRNGQPTTVAPATEIVDNALMFSPTDLVLFLR